MEVTGNSGFERKIPAMGTYNARVARIYDFGTQEKTFNGQVTGTRHSGQWIFELVDTNEDFGKGFPEPFHVETKELTLSLGGTSNTMRDYIGALLCRPIVKTENIKLEQFINMPCMIQVVHAKSKDGTKTYANISSVMAHPTPNAVAPLRTQPIFFEISANNPNMFNQFLAINNKWTQGIIVKSPEFQQLSNAANFPWQQHIFVKGGAQQPAPAPQQQFAAPQQQFQAPTPQQYQQQQAAPQQQPWTPPVQTWPATGQPQQPALQPNQQFLTQAPAPQQQFTPQPPQQPQWPAPIQPGAQQQPANPFQPAPQQPQFTPQAPQQPAANPFQAAPQQFGPPPGYKLDPLYPNVVGAEQYIPDTPF